MFKDDVKKFCNRILTSSGSTSINRGQVLKTLEMSATDHRELIRVLGDFNRINQGKTRGAIMNAASNKKNAGCVAYKTYLGKLQGNAKTAEEGTVFMTLKVTCEVYAKVYELLIDDLEKYIEEKHVTPGNMKMSHGAILGTIERGQQFAKFVKFMMNVIVYDITGEVPAPPKGRMKHINQYMPSVVNTVNSVYKRQGVYQLLNGLKELKKTNTDVKLTRQGKVNTMIDTFKFNKVIQNNWLLRVNPFEWMGTRAADWEHEKFEEMKATKEWMQAMVDMLRLDLDDMDPNAAEYRHTAKVIENYEVMIRTSNAKLDEYYGTEDK